MGVLSVVCVVGGVDSGGVRRAVESVVAEKGEAISHPKWKERERGRVEYCHGSLALTCIRSRIRGSQTIGTVTCHAAGKRTKHTTKQDVNRCGCRDLA
jgi:hypothetical protein